jgi:hypothetical protein
MPFNGQILIVIAVVGAAMWFMAWTVWRTIRPKGRCKCGEQTGADSSQPTQGKSTNLTVHGRRAS